MPMFPTSLPCGNQFAHDRPPRETKNVNATVSSRRAGPVNPAKARTSSKTAMTPASRSRNLSAFASSRADAGRARGLTWGNATGIENGGVWQVLGQWQGLVGSCRHSGERAKPLAVTRDGQGLRRLMWGASGGAGGCHNRDDAGAPAGRGARRGCMRTAQCPPPGIRASSLTGAWMVSKYLGGQAGEGCAGRWRRGAGRRGSRSGCRAGAASQVMVSS